MEAETRKAMRFAVLSVVVLAGLCLGALWFLGEMQAQARRAANMGDAKTLILCSRGYAQDHDGVLPPLDPRPGRLMFDPEAMYPDYCANPGVVAAEFDDNVPEEVWSHSHDGGAWGKDLIDDYSFFYLGYALTSAEEGMHFVDAYRRRAEEGLPFDTDLTVGEGKGTLGAEILLRLRIESPEKSKPGASSGGPIPPDMAAKIPVFVERPRHVPRLPGGSVAYLDGHVEFLDYPGPWPMSEDFIWALKSLDALDVPDQPGG